MTALIFGLCAVTSILCAFLLLYGYSQTKTRFLLWSGLCFVGLSINNSLLVVDYFWLPEADLRIFRATATLIGMILLMYGLVFESEG